MSMKEISILITSLFMPKLTHSETKTHDTFHGLNRKFSKEKEKKEELTRESEYFMASLPL